MGKEKVQKGKIDVNNRNLEKLLSKLNKPKEATDDVDAPAQAAGGEEGAGGAADVRVGLLGEEGDGAADGGDDEAKEEEAVEMKKEEAAKAIKEARESGVKDKCSSMLLKEVKQKDKEAKMNAE